MQRICKYPLLLKELHKGTPQSHADHDHIAKALTEMTAIVHNINATTRDAENVRKLAEIESSLTDAEVRGETDAEKQSTTRLSMNSTVVIVAHSIDEWRSSIRDGGSLEEEGSNATILVVFRYVGVGKTQVRKENIRIQGCVMTVVFFHHSSLLFRFSFQHIFTLSLQV
jgi:hypothetical protein